MWIVHSGVTMKLAVRLTAFMLLLVMGSFSLGSQANAGTYTYKDCRYGLWQGDVLKLKSPSTVPYEFSADASTCNSLHAIQIYGGGVGNDYDQDDAGSLNYVAPSGSGFVGTDLMYYNLNSSSGFNGNGVRATAQFSNSGGADPLVIAQTSTNTSPSYLETFTNYTIPSGGRRTVFKAVLRCMWAHCDDSGAWIQVGDIQLRLDDYTAPVAVHGGNGTIYAGGALSGTKTVDAVAADGQGGVKNTYVKINGAVAAYGTPVSCTPFKLTPCDHTRLDFIQVNTAQAPFVEGLNYVQTCAYDYAEAGSANSACEATGQWVLVDNP